ncbi:MAG: hypothetical protein AUK47_08205 [Deltaproteobacteria bacterium CG2_30_63_29]|nr:MAG: hypothetical protein AUK47_08205 [Deltaproteobacteria bacterium CG2_30_63_29]PIW02715.1 MAG: hypothetical protein COW42_00140 [Deltaproteobacteria bacterium CG17_big_fil_post_rev_8_21_14_2_50_63_7]PJB46257.1 MAG: hypothetical protein CO108_06050 [Deltaproteobacteria bacterium CG_4_9_14_3_um_filter_63_12]
MNKTLQLFLKLGAVLLAFSLLMACETTPEAQQQRYKKNIDQLELKANKLPPTTKTDIQKKVGEFNVDFEKAGSDIDNLRALNSRVEKYIEEVDKMTVPPATSVPGNKIGTTRTQTGGVPATGGKLGGAGMPAGGMPMGGTGLPAGGSGMPMGGTGTPMGGTAQPGGKLGGSAPVAPPVGTPPANNGGFGGK